MSGLYFTYLRTLFEDEGIKRITNRKKTDEICNRDII
jgi:hypothetical protein